MVKQDRDNLMQLLKFADSLTFIDKFLRMEVMTDITKKFEKYHNPTGISEGYVPTNYKPKNNEPYKSTNQNKKFDKSEDTSNAYTIYTDGSCMGNPGPGGFGFIIINDKTNKISYYLEQFDKTTNNRMELQSVISALNSIPYLNKVTVYSDSEYCINGINQNWITNWQKNGWKTSSGTLVKNRDLWEDLVDAINRHKWVSFKKVKAHNNDVYNEYADKLAKGTIPAQLMSCERVNFKNSKNTY